MCTLAGRRLFAVMNIARAFNESIKLSKVHLVVSIASLGFNHF
jgi:hypothetical protein